MDRSDCPTRASWLTDPYLLLMAAPDWHHPLTAADVEAAYFDKANGIEALKAIEDGRMVGHLSFYRPRPDAGHLIHVIVEPALKGRTAAPWSRRSYGGRSSRRNYAASRCTSTRRTSLPSPAICARLRIEGYHREATLWNGRTFDTYSMALLRHEWESRFKDMDR